MGVLLTVGSWGLGEGTKCGAAILLVGSSGFVSWFCFEVCSVISMSMAVTASWNRGAMARTSPFGPAKMLEPSKTSSSCPPTWFA